MIDEVLVKREGMNHERASQNFPLFEQLADELRGKLELVDTVQAKDLHERAVDFYKVFHGWTENPPRPDDRVAKIRALMDFVREANEYLKPK